MAPQFNIIADICTHESKVASLVLIPHCFQNLRNTAAALGFLILRQRRIVMLLLGIIRGENYVIDNLIEKNIQQSLRSVQDFRDIQYLWRPAAEVLHLKADIAEFLRVDDIKVVVPANIIAKSFKDTINLIPHVSASKRFIG